MFRYFNDELIYFYYFGVIISVENALRSSSFVSDLFQ